MLVNWFSRREIIINLIGFHGEQKKMNKNDIVKLHYDILNIFIKTKPDLVHLMKSCDYGIGIDIPDNNHLEGDVWCHVLFSYNAMLSIPQFYDLNEEQIVMSCISILFHDIGKLYCRTIKNDKVHFYNQEKRSVIEIINNIEFIQYWYGLNDISLHRIIMIVSALNQYHLCSNFNNIFPFLNYDSYAFDIYKVVVTANQMGRISDNRSKDLDIYIDKFNVEDPTIVNENNVSVYLMVGAPSSGKDYVINSIFSQYEPIVISYNDISVREFTNYNKKLPVNLNDIDVYKFSRRWCSENKISLLSGLLKDINEAISNGHKTIIINNNNIDIESRKEILTALSFISNISIEACIVYSSIKSMIIRENKYDADYIKEIAYSFELPTMNEGFNNIHIVMND